MRRRTQRAPSRASAPPVTQTVGAAKVMIDTYFSINEHM
jgi:hypothetical protein